MTKKCHNIGGFNVEFLLESYFAERTLCKSTQVFLSLKPKILVSACLVGQPVTYRGGSCPSSALQRTPLGFIVNCLWRQEKLIECVPICPEMDILALPSPRPPVRLVQKKNIVRIVSRDAADVPIPSVPSCEESLKERLSTRHPCLAEELLIGRLSGFDGCLFKSRSPACGVGDARLYNNEHGGSYVHVDGFFVDEWVRAKDTSILICSERQLYFDEKDSFAKRAIKVPGGGKSVLSFLGDVIERFERRSVVSNG